IPVINAVTNNYPIAQNDVGYTEVGTSLESSILANDMDPDVKDELKVAALHQMVDVFYPGDEVSVSGVNLENNSVAKAGIFSVSPDGKYYFKPQSGFTGVVDPIGYTINDGNGGKDKAKLIVSVLRQDDNYTFANDDARALPKRIAFEGNVLLN